MSPTWRSPKRNWRFRFPQGSKRGSSRTRVSLKWNRLKPSRSRSSRTCWRESLRPWQRRVERRAARQQPAPQLDVAQELVRPRPDARLRLAEPLDVPRPPGRLVERRRPVRRLDARQRLVELRASRRQPSGPQLRVRLPRRPDAPRPILLPKAFEPVMFEAKLKLGEQPGREQGRNEQS